MGGGHTIYKASFSIGGYSYTKNVGGIRRSLVTMDCKLVRHKTCGISSKFRVSREGTSGEDKKHEMLGEF